MCETVEVSISGCRPRKCRGTPMRKRLSAARLPAIVIQALHVEFKGAHLDGCSRGPAQGNSPSAASPAKNRFRSRGRRVRYLQEREAAEGVREIRYRCALLLLAHTLPHQRSNLFFECLVRLAGRGADRRSRKTPAIRSGARSPENPATARLGIPHQSPYRWRG